MAASPSIRHWIGIKAKNEAALRHKTACDPPPHMSLQQSTLSFSLSTASLVGTKQKDKNPDAPQTTTPALAAATRTNPSPSHSRNTHVQKRTKTPAPWLEADTPFNKAAQHLWDARMFGLIGKIDLRFVTNALFKVASCLQDTGTSELLHALATIQDKLLLQQAVEQVTHMLRDAAKEITGNLTNRVAELTAETVTAVQQGVIKAGRELDKCTDVVKVATGDLKATAESPPRMFTSVLSTGIAPSSAPGLLQPSTQAKMEQDHRRILIDPPAGRTQLYPTAVENIGVTRKATEALHQAGGKLSWTFVSCIKLEKGVYSLKPIWRRSRNGSPTGSI
ncbi:hypothetical protein PTI98_008929 [Pleurotus ostreatus]|nr:hypothetical protein PTI98_008929 [Pleurotus ostreatus]